MHFVLLVWARGGAGKPRAAHLLAWGQVAPRVCRQERARWEAQTGDQVALWTSVPVRGRKYTTNIYQSTCK